MCENYENKNEAACFPLALALSPPWIGEGIGKVSAGGRGDNRRTVALCNEIGAAKNAQPKP